MQIDKIMQLQEQRQKITRKNSNKNKHEIRKLSQKNPSLTNKYK